MRRFLYRAEYFPNILRPIVLFISCVVISVRWAESTAVMTSHRSYSTHESAARNEPLGNLLKRPSFKLFNKTYIQMDQFKLEIIPLPQLTTFELSNGIVEIINSVYICMLRVGFVANQKGVCIYYI